MEKLLLKIKITVLWLLFAGAASVAKILGLIEGIMEGLPITADASMFFALCWLIPMVMAFLSLVLKDTANRWTNFVLGILFAVVGIVELVSHFIEGWGPSLLLTSLFMLLGSLFMTVVPALIAWYAWKWPKQEA